MKHVIRLQGSRLRTRIPYQINHVRPSSSLGGGDEAKDSSPTKTRTLHSRSHGNSSLPTSALFDPVTIAARTKYEEPKPLSPQKSAELTPFQKELAENVYAQALQTPVRTCVLTKARLPAHFLIPFISQLPPKSPTTNPETPLKPSLVPRIGAWAPHSKHPSSYVLASHSAITHLSGPRMRKRNKGGAKWAMLLTERMKRPWAARERKSVEKVEGMREWEWDEEMVERVRGLLGREVVRRVKWCKERGEGERLVERVGEDGDGGEGGSTVVRIGGEGEVLVGYDLRGMMDEELLAEISGLVGGAEEFVLRRHPKNVYTVLALEALKNYVEGSEK